MIKKRVYLLHKQPIEKALSNLPQRNLVSSFEKNRWSLPKYKNSVNYLGNNMNNNNNNVNSINDTNNNYNIYNTKLICKNVISMPQRKENELNTQ